MTRRPHYEGDPTLLRVMVRPQWIAALILALAVAGGFAWLGQWQLEHAITVESETTEHSETPTPLVDLTEPGAPVGDASAGRVASLTARFVPVDFSVVEERENGGRVGAWVVGHLAVGDSADSAAEGGAAIGHLAVAVGWAPTPAEAADAAEILAQDRALAESFDLTGRYMPSDATVVPVATEDPLRVSSMAPAQLVNLWEPFDGPAYGGYLVLHPGAATAEALAASGLSAIDSVPPLPPETVNWLNLFYAVEWVVFAGFAVFFWYRLTRDAWEKEHERQRAELAASAEPGQLD